MKYLVKYHLFSGAKIEGESRYGIMEFTWRAGTPLWRLNEESPHIQSAEIRHQVPHLSGKPVELKEPFMLHSHGNRHQRQLKIPKSQSVPPLNHRKIKPFAEKRLNLFRAINSLNQKEYLVALGEYIKNRNIIQKTEFLDKKGNLLPGSFTDHPPPPNTATPIQVSLPLSSCDKHSVTSVSSGNSSGRCSKSVYDQARDVTCDALLDEINKFHLPPISRVGGENRGP